MNQEISSHLFYSYDNTIRNAAVWVAKAAGRKQFNLFNGSVIMKRLPAITKRLHDEANPDKNTDEKLEDGSTMAWITYSESDVKWLLSRVDEFLEAGQQVVAELNARIDAAPDSAKPVFRGLAELHATIQRTINDNDVKPLIET